MAKKWRLARANCPEPSINDISKNFDTSLTPPHSSVPYSRNLPSFGQNLGNPSFSDVIREWSFDVWERSEIVVWMDVPVAHENDPVHALDEAVLVDDGDSRPLPQDAVVADHPVGEREKGSIEPGASI